MDSLQLSMILTLLFPTFRMMKLREIFLLQKDDRHKSTKYLNIFDLKNYFCFKIVYLYAIWSSVYFVNIVSLLGIYLSVSTITLSTLPDVN